MLTSKRPLPASADAVSGRSRGSDAGLVLLLALGLLVFLAGMYPVKGWYFPVGPDTPVYLWWTKLAAHDGLSAVGSRPGVPSLVLMLAGTLRLSRVQALGALGPVGGIAIGLAAAALVQLGSGPGRGGAERRMRMLAAGALAGTFAVHLADGYFANLVQAALFLAGAAAIASGSVDGAGGAAALLGASALTHPQFFLLSCGILLLAAIPTLARRRGRRLTEVEGGRILASLLGGGALAGAGFAALTLGPGLPHVDTSQDAFLRRAGLRGLLRREYRGRFIRHLARYVLEVQVPLGALGLGEMDGFVGRFLGAWAVVLVVGVAGSLLTNLAPAVRFFSFAYVLPILAGLGLVRLYRWLATRTRAPIGAVLASGLAVAVVLGAAFTWTGTKPYVARTELRRAAVAGRITAAAAPGAPVVFVVDTGGRNVSFTATRAGNVIRDAVPASLIRRVHVYVGSPQDYLANRPTLTGGRTHDAMSRLYLRDIRRAGGHPIAFVLAPFNRPYFDEGRNDGDLVSRGVIELRPHPPTPTLPTSTPSGASPSSSWGLALSALAALALLGAIGLGWARSVLPGPAGMALAPSFGMAGVILVAILFERLGGPLTGWGPPFVSAVVGGGGYLAMLRSRRRRVGNEAGPAPQPEAEIP